MGRIFDACKTLGYFSSAAVVAAFSYLAFVQIERRPPEAVALRDKIGSIETVSIQTSSGEGLKFSVLIAGDKTNPAVVLVHGFPDTFLSFEKMANRLVESGYYVIAPSLRGYERSSIASSYFIIDMAEDLLAIMDKLSIKRAHLIGHDWGSIIGSVLIKLSPDRFASYSSLAIIPKFSKIDSAQNSPPLRQLRNMWYMMFFQFPWLPENIIPRGDFYLIDKLFRDWSPDFSEEERKSRASDVKNAFSDPDVLVSALSYYRSNIFALVLSHSERLRSWFSPRALIAPEILTSTEERSVPVQLIYGKNDGCQDEAMFVAEDLTKFFPKGYRILPIENAGHWMHLEKPEEVNALIIEWLEKYPL
uniref:Epoxide hydrolase n=1 Tax=Hirondellea gigas TaxID=1518452 RepID=A0A6A7G6X4_9CRUS